MENQKKIGKWKITSWQIGLTITIVYIISILLLICFYNDHGLAQFKSMRLNEIGDFFAGVFGPVAFFWLILGYRLQQTELKQNTDALKLQAKELKNTVEQQKQLVSIEEGRTKADIKRAKPDIRFNGKILVLIEHINNRSQVTGVIHNYGSEAKNIEIQLQMSIMV